jgi:hypothetical protein
LAAPTLDALSGLRCAVYWKDEPRTEAQQKDGEKGRWWTATDQPHAQGVPCASLSGCVNMTDGDGPGGRFLFGCSFIAHSMRRVTRYYLVTEKTGFFPRAVRVAWPVGTLHEFGVEPARDLWINWVDCR